MSLAVITTLRRQLGEWTARAANEQFLRRDQEAQLRAALAGPVPRPQAHVAAWMLGTWHLTHGLMRVLDGDAEGFDAARVGQALRRGSLLLRMQQQPPAHRRGGARLPFSRLHGTWTALLGLALHDPGAEPLLELLRGEPEGAFGDDEPLPLFTRALLQLHAGRRPAVTSRLGPWQAVLLQWDGDPRLLAQSLAQLLDRHLAATQSAADEFGDPPCKLYPVEVLAVQAVRTWLGLPMPKVDHPLMFTNLGTMRPTTPWPQHELVRRLEQQLRARPR